MIGVLALQGGFRAHIEKIEELGGVAKIVRHPAELAWVSGLIIPGGESTTISSLLNPEFTSALIKFGSQKPIFGTCAGLIICANLRLIDIEIERNAYGRQIDSFSTELMVQFEGKQEITKAIFIRAPKITKVLSKEVEILSYFQDEPVFVSQKNIFCATFHPELTESQLIHSLFLRKCHEFTYPQDSCFHSC